MNFTGDLTEHGFNFLDPKDFNTKQQGFDVNTSYENIVYSGTYYEKELPTEAAIKLVHDLLLDLLCNYTTIEKVELEKKLEYVMFFISDKLPKGVTKLPEWNDLLKALKMQKFKYASNHPCLWEYKKRLRFFDDLYSLVTSQDDKERSIVYEAIIDTNTFDDDWRVVLDDPHEAPLKRVFEKYGNVFVMPSEASREEKRWAEGGEMIFFMKNCVDYLTEVEIGVLKERYYTHIDFMSDDPLYKDIEFFNHMATHFLYPKLWIELYAALCIAGYKF